jgi:tRNA threonylcarbamoyladenosine biosynthesis protein TsaE
MIAPQTIESRSPEQTQALGAALGKALRVGDAVALVGPLGAGKTVFVKGVAHGAGVPAGRPVTSPTFVLVNEYEGRVRIHHVDAYRLNNANDLLALGVDEFLECGAVLLEWADRVPGALPDDRLTIAIKPVGDTMRRFALTARGPRSTKLQRAVAAAASSTGPGAS